MISSTSMNQFGSGGTNPSGGLLSSVMPNKFGGVSGNNAYGSTGGTQTNGGNQSTGTYNVLSGVPGAVQGNNPGLLHQSLINTVANQGGSHSMTDTAGNTSTVKVTPPKGNITNTQQATTAGQYDAQYGAQGSYNNAQNNGTYAPTPQVAGSTTQTPPATTIPTTGTAPTLTPPGSTSPTYVGQDGNTYSSTSGQMTSQGSTQSGLNGYTPPTNSNSTTGQVAPVGSATNTSATPYSGGGTGATTPFGQSVQNITNTANTGANNVVGTANTGANSITGAANGQYSGLLGNSINNVNTTAAGNIPLGQNAQNLGNQYQNAISGLGVLNNQATGQMSNGGVLNVAQGAGALDYQNYTNRLGNLTASENAALQGNSQALTAQNQAQSGYSNAGQLAATGLNSQIGAATSAGQLATGGAENAATTATNAGGTAAGYTAPQSYSVGSGVNAPYNPTTDTYGGGGISGVSGKVAEGANLGSISTLTTANNNLQPVLDTATSNYQNLTSLISAGGIPSDIPLINALTVAYQNEAGGPAKVAQAQQQIQNLLTQYATITGNAMPDITKLNAGQLAGINEQVQTDGANIIAANKRKIASLSSGGSSSSGGDVLGLGITL